MTIMDAIAERHSVRAFTPRPLDFATWDALDSYIREINDESRLSFTLITDDPTAFGQSLLAKYGHFENVQNFIVCAGPKGPDLEERVGYFGEAIVLKAQMLGLNTCWVGLTFSKSNVRRLLKPGERLVCVIAMGYGVSAGSSHPVKSEGELSTVKGEVPEWFEQGMWAATLAPTALNQQRWHITLENGVCRLTTAPGPYTALDRGIVRRHFEIGAANAGEAQVAWL